VRAAAAVEMLHIALLIHDDIIDRDSTRHGQLNLSGRYQVVYKGEDAREAAHYADGAAMLAGDLGISAAYQLLLSSSFSPEKQVAAMRLLGDAIFDVAGGQLLDMEASLQDIQKPDSLKIAQLKTSSYSFVAPLAIGATLAGASAQTLQALAEYGDALGIAFQLADDILGLFGNESVTGKSTTTDVAEGKPTFLMQQAVARSSATDRAELLELLGDHSLTSLQLQRARKLVRQSGALEETERRIASYAEAAHAAAARAGLHEEAMHALYACIAQATRRDR
jgi:geranylgeranyl diphosphate synthase type II